MEVFKTIISYKDIKLGYSKVNVLKVIHVLEKFSPPDDYILTYGDFLKRRDFVRYTVFNISVFNAIVTLALDIWDTEKRINRLSLLTVLKRYNKKNPDTSSIPPETASKLFELFRQIVFFQNIKKNLKTFDEMKRLINSVMLNLKLKDEELKWLCDNAEASEIILNRVLRYKYKSSVITNWVKENFNNDFLRKRRAELIGWMIDEDINFEVNREVLRDDFEYMNKLDIKILEKYDADLLDYKLKEDLTKTFAEKTEDNIFEDPFGPSLFPSRKNDNKPPELIFESRFYEGYPGFNWSEVRKFKEKNNYDKFREIFLNNIDYIIKSSMIWGIGYSRLENKTKAKLLVKYYDEKLNHAYFKISIMNKNLELLKWLYENEK